MNRIMEEVALNNPEKIIVTYQGKHYFGANQAWFTLPIRQYGGCGVICAFNMLKNAGDIVVESDLLLEKLDEIYTRIKPFEIEGRFTKGLIDKNLLYPTFGIYSLKLFERKIKRYIALNKQIGKIKRIPLKKGIYDQTEACYHLLVSELKKSSSIGFLNTFKEATLYLSRASVDKELSNNLKVKDMSRFERHTFRNHWVFVTGVIKAESEEGKISYYVQCSTWGQVAYFDLKEVMPQNIGLRVFPPGFIIMENE